MTQLFNDGWEFSKQPLFTSLSQMQERQEQFAPVGIPHDWLIYHADRLYEDSTGWYRRILEWQVQEEEKVFLRFEGVYMDCHVYVNPWENLQPVYEWKYGYSTFEVELTPYLKNGKNEIWVSVDYQSPNSRWYSGAGIYRNVWLKTVHETYLAADGIYFHAEKDADGENWEAEISAEVIIADKKVDSPANSITVSFSLEDRETGEKILLDEVSTECGEEKKVVLKTTIENPKIWDLENPHCYQLCVTLSENGRVLQEETQTVGFRTPVFDPAQGFLLNGRKVKLNGVCEHHDLGCIGSAFHPQALRRELELLKEMGTNAIRTSHNMPAPDLMELADEMGILIVSEAFDMWEYAKTPYDYARFFPEWYPKDVASWVRRDRNHPCLILWSIGNEIPDTHASERGQMWTTLLMEETRKHDPRGNALPTIGSNYMLWENGQKCADILKIAGYNYGAVCYDKHHKEHPDWVIYGSETASVVQSRGIYHFPYEKPVLADVDEQCSSLGNSTTSWGAKSAEDCLIAERDHPYSAGQFIWTGFDYIGEPTPYHTRNSYFGQIDTAGFPKDSFYIYQAEWTDRKKKTVLHLFPYWDFNEGQLIDVRAYTNGASVELFVNGKSQGIRQIDHVHGEVLSGDWKVPYEKGEIRAIAYDENGNVLAEESRHSFGEASEIDIKLSKTGKQRNLQKNEALKDKEKSAFDFYANKNWDDLREKEEEKPDLHLYADGQDLLFLEISMKDAEGHPVENANNRVNIAVSGAGMLIGTDNGDSTDTEEYKCGSRRLFSGKLLAVIKADVTPGELNICVSSEGLQEKQINLKVLPSEIQKGSSSLAYCFEKEETQAAETKQDIPVRNIYLTSQMGNSLSVENPYTIVEAKLCPENAADQEVIWSVVDDGGIPSILATLEPDGHKVKVTAKSDGKFRLRCMSKCGTDKIRIISQLEFTVEGMGVAYLDPYGFVTGGLYDYGYGDLGNGNEHGVATARGAESRVGFRYVDFGPFGSDEICLPIFALSGDPYEIKIYEGIPGEENAELIGDVIYQKPMIWNVYQEETYRLKKRLKGVTSICFVLKEKVHIKGFSFTRKNKAFEQLFAGDCDQIYGDTFERDGEWMRGIGNNVTLAYQDMDFGENGVSEIRICGKTPLAKNTIILNVKDEEKERRIVLEYTKREGEQIFTLEKISGTCEIQFIFLPGSQFDFHSFCFR